MASEPHQPHQQTAGAGDPAAAGESPPPPAAAAEPVTDGDLQELERRHQRFIWPVTIFFLVYYLSLPVLAGSAHGLMSARVFGEFTFGYLFALSQFVMAFLVAWAYSRYARRRIDPLASAVRTRLSSVTDREVVGK